MQMNIRKILYLYCGETYEDMIDHRSYAHSLSSCEMKAWKKKKFRSEQDFKPMTSTILVQCLPTEPPNEVKAGHIVYS